LWLLQVTWYCLDSDEMGTQTEWGRQGMHKDFGEGTSLKRVIWKTKKDTGE